VASTIRDLTELTTVAPDDYFLVSDTSDVVNRDKRISRTNILTGMVSRVGSPVGGHVAVWTDGVSIQGSGIPFAQMAQKSGTPVAGNNVQWLDANTVGDGGIAVSSLARKSGVPVAGRVASWLDGNTVQDGGFAVSDVARLSQNQTFAGRATFTAAGGTSGNGAFIGLGQAGYATRVVMLTTVTKRIYGTFVAFNNTNSVTLVGTIDILNGATQIITLGASNTWTFDVSAADNTFGIIRTAGAGQLTFASWLSWI
jgi:hypothetical protein